jgi:hypothetical protein
MVIMRWSPQCRSPPRHRQKIYSDWYARGRRNKGSLKFVHLTCQLQQQATESHAELEFLPDVVNDLDVDFSENLAASDVYKNDQRNIRKVREATEKLQINVIHPLREGKKLLVLDIDYSKPAANLSLHLFSLLFQLYWTQNH